MTKLLTLIFLAVSSNALAVEFKNFALKNELKELNETMDIGSSGARSARAFGGVAGESAVDTPTHEEQRLRAQVAEKLLGLKSATGGVNETTSPLLQKIAQALANNYNQIGQEQTAPLVLNHDIGGGVLNFSGFTWNKPFANFKLYVNRQLSPDLYSDRWIVHDTLVLGVSASTLLTNMREADLIDISDEGIGAFAGIGFSREYKYSHFADSFLDGLQADYSKLFLAFSKFTPNHVLNMPHYEIMKLNDKFTFNAGGVVNFPGGGLSGRTGVLVSVAHERKLTLQSLGPNDYPEQDEFLRLGVESSTDTSVGAALGLQVDFFNLLKISLLSADLEYSYGRTNKTLVDFYEKDKPLIKSSPSHRQEFKKLVSARSDQVLEFRENITSLEERIRKSLRSQYSILLFGSVKKRETEQVKIVKDGIEKVFYKHYAESIKFVQNLWSRIFGTIVYALFDWDSGVKNAAEVKKRLAVEFEHIENIGEAKVDGPDKFSLTLTQSFQAAKTHRWWHGLYRRESRRHLAKMTNLESKYVEMVNDKKLRGPLSINSKIHILADGLNHFNFLDENIAFRVFKAVCDGKRRCQKLLRRKYISYAGHFHRYGIIDIMRFKSFIGSYFKRIRHYRDIHLLFGEQNVFMNGSFNATTSDGQSFATYFKEGEFQGLGVIDTFIRDGVNGGGGAVSREPANISAK